MIKIKNRPTKADYIQCCNPTLVRGNEKWPLGVGCEWVVFIYNFTWRQICPHF